MWTLQKVWCFASLSSGSLCKLFKVHHRCGLKLQLETRISMKHTVDWKWYQKVKKYKYTIHSHTDCPSLGVIIRWQLRFKDSVLRCTLPPQDRGEHQRVTSACIKYDRHYFSEQYFYCNHLPGAECKIQLLKTVIPRKYCFLIYQNTPQINLIFLV